MLIENPKYFCVVCGKQLPDVPRQTLIERGCAVVISIGHNLYICPGNVHTKEEIENSALGVPRFKKASEIKRGII
jgi:hypothetical protein